MDNEGELTWLPLVCPCLENKVLCFSKDLYRYYIVSKTEPGQHKVSVNNNLHNNRIYKFAEYLIITKNT